MMEPTRRAAGSASAGIGTGPSTGHRLRPGPNRLQGLLWATFATTAVIAAVLVPAHILIQGVLAPLGLVPAFDRQPDTFAAALSNFLVKLYLLVLIGTSFYTAAHRLRYLVHEMGVHAGKGLLAILMYGLAAVGTFTAAYVIFTVP